MVSSLSFFGVAEFQGVIRFKNEKKRIQIIKAESAFFTFEKRRYNDRLKVAVQNLYLVNEPIDFGLALTIVYPVVSIRYFCGGTSIDFS